MIIFMDQIVDVFMHALFLLGLIPFLLLFVLLCLAALIIVVSAVVEFPLLLLGVVSLGLVIHSLSKPSKKQELVCG